MAPKATATKPAVEDVSDSPKATAAAEATKPAVKPAAVQEPEDSDDDDDYDSDEDDSDDGKGGPGLSFLLQDVRLRWPVEWSARGGGLT